MAFATTTREISTVWDTGGGWCLPANDDNELSLVFPVLFMNQFPEHVS